MAALPGRPAPAEYPAFEELYVSRVPEGGLVEVLDAQLADTLAVVREVSEERASQPHAPGAWSMKEVLGHLSDVERVLSFRALWVARGGNGPLPGFAPEVWAATGEFGERSLDSLILELQKVRQATVALFSNFSRKDWLRVGDVAGLSFSVRALGYVIAGHELHHRENLRARYLEEEWIGG